MVTSKLTETVQVPGIGWQVALVGTNRVDRLTVQVGPEEVEAVPQLVGP